jgi:hypothetical protein
MIRYGLFPLFPASRICERGPPGLRCRHAGGIPIVRAYLRVATQFVVELFFNVMLAEEIAQNAPDPRPDTHRPILSNDHTNVPCVPAACQ